MNYRELGNATIPRPEGQQLFYKDGDTADIATKLLKVFKEQRHQVDALAPKLRGATLLDTCRNIFNIVKQNIAYQMDPKGTQWVRRPAQMWWSGVGDCKSYSVFIASCLDRLGIAGTFRFVSFAPVEKDQPLPPPTHVYVVVKNNGSEIIIDAVLPRFNVEKPYTVKYDYNMTRIYELSGVSTSKPTRQGGAVIINGTGDATLNGGLSTALNKNARRQLFANSLPGLAMLSLYQFIPGGSGGDFERAIPGMQTSDNLLSAMPQAVKDKRFKSFQSFWDMGDWADWKVEQDVFPKLRAELKTQLGMDPADWWRLVINQYCGAQAGVMGLGAIDPATAMAAASTVKSMLDKVKNVVGNLFGGSDFQWKRGAPDTWAPDQSDWAGYRCVPLNYLQVGKGVPVTGTGQVSWNDVINTNPPATTTPVSQTYIPSQPPVNQQQQPLPTDSTSGSNTGLIIAAVAVGALILIKNNV